MGVQRQKCNKCDQRAERDEETKSHIEHLEIALEKQNRRVTMLNEMYAELQESFRTLKNKYEALLSSNAPRTTCGCSTKGDRGKADSQRALCSWGTSNGNGCNSGPN